MRPSANYWHDANDEGIKKENRTETDRHELEGGRVMTMVKFYSNFKLIRKVTLVDPFDFKSAHQFLKKKMIFKNLILFSVKVFTSGRSGDFVITLEANRGPSGWELHGFNGEWSMKSRNH